MVLSSSYYTSQKFLATPSLPSLSSGSRHQSARVSSFCTWITDQLVQNTVFICSHVDKEVYCIFLIFSTHLLSYSHPHSISTPVLKNLFHSIFCPSKTSASPMPCISFSTTSTFLSSSLSLVSTPSVSMSHSAFSFSFLWWPISPHNNANCFNTDPFSRLVIFNIPILLCLNTNPNDVACTKSWSIFLVCHSHPIWSIFSSLRYQIHIFHRLYCITDLYPQLNIIKQVNFKRI